MFLAVAVGFPVVLLLAVLGMEQVERRLGDGRAGRPDDEEADGRTTPGRG